MAAREKLIATYERASPTVRRRGRSWYPEARRVLERMAAEHGRTTAQAVAVFAITSADAQLVNNLRFTEKILRGDRTYGRYPSHQTPLVLGALSTTHPARFVRGPKCTAFYRAIMGDTNALVLDRWAARAAGIRHKRVDLVGIRRELEKAYAEAASLCEETMRAFQAIVWIVTRESTANTRAFIPAYRDIHQASMKTGG